jgi:hypothetical protein
MTTLTRPTQSQRRAKFLAAASAAIAMTVALGFNLWLQQDSDTGSRDAGSITTSAVTESGPAVSGNTGTTAPASSASKVGPQVYIVATPEEATNLHASMVAFGNTEQPYEVLVVTPGEEGERTLAMLRERDQLRAHNGLLPLNITDLR